VIKYLIAVGLLVFASLSSMEAHAQSKQPFEIVRSLHALQDQVALGSTAAQAALPKAIAQIADRLVAVDPEVWRNPKNARAAVTYVLSGGQARVIRKVLEAGKSGDLERKLLSGALAYSEGQELKAKQMLESVDARELGSMVGGHIAIVQAALVAHDDPNKAMRALDIARLLAPGTLIEEAALRREIVIASDTGNLEKFVFLSSQYLRRFQNSVYASNFRQLFANAVMQFGLASSAAQLPRLEKVLNELEAQDQLRLYLLVAQSAIVKGKGVSAKFAAERAAQIARASGVEEARANLYEAAAQVLGSNYEAGVPKLEMIDTKQLPKPDADLKDAVLAVAKQVRKWPDEVLPPLGMQPELSAIDVDDPKVRPINSPMMERARNALTDADVLLKRGQP
jgi:chemotaxis protein MotC